MNKDRNQPQSGEETTQQQPGMDKNETLQDPGSEVVDYGRSGQTDEEQVTGHNALNDRTRQGNPGNPGDGGDTLGNP